MTTTGSPESREQEATQLDAPHQYMPSKRDPHYCARCGRRAAVHPDNPCVVCGQPSLDGVCVGLVGIPDTAQQHIRALVHLHGAGETTCRCGSTFDSETGVCNRTGILANHCDAPVACPAELRIEGAPCTCPKAPNNPFYDALEELSNEANAMPPDCQPSAWQDLALRFARMVDGVTGARAALERGPCYGNTESSEPEHGAPR